MTNSAVPSDLAGAPTEPVAVPVAVSAVLGAHGLGAAALAAVWQNGVGGLTFSAATGGPGAEPDYFVKWNPGESGESLADEAKRLVWLSARHPAPAVVGLANWAVAGEGDEPPRYDEVLITRALPGESAVSERWKAEPARALRALGTGLRRLHDLSAEDCPFDWGVAERTRIAGIAAGTLADPPPIDKLVVCQGDPCAPNTLISRDGDFLAHVDLARLGLADRWADLAIMTLSLGWNYTNYDERDFWDAYGIEPDAERIAYYRALWDAE